jgi:hypothetical protein
MSSRTSEAGLFWYSTHPLTVIFSFTSKVCLSIDNIGLDMCVAKISSSNTNKDSDDKNNIAIIHILYIFVLLISIFI